MSAAPERMSGKRRAIRIRRFHVYKNRKNIMEEILKSGAFLPFPNAWRPLVFQKSRGNTQTALIFTIFAYTYGRQREKGEKIPLWNWNKMPDCPWGPPLQATDIADENSLSDREIRDDIEDAIDRGLME